MITRFFRKELKNFSSKMLKEVIVLIQKYHRGLETNLFVIQEHPDYCVLKGYLAGKSVRILVAKYNESFIPLLLFKKESKNGWNITADFDVSHVLEKTAQCLRDNQFEVIPIN